MQRTAYIANKSLLHICTFISNKNTIVNEVKQILIDEGDKS